LKVCTFTYENNLLITCLKDYIPSCNKNLFTRTETVHSKANCLSPCQEHKENCTDTSHQGDKRREKDCPRCMSCFTKTAKHSGISECTYMPKSIRMALWAKDKK